MKRRLTEFFRWYLFGRLNITSEDLALVVLIWVSLGVLMALSIR